MLNILGLADVRNDSEAVAKTLAPAVRSLSVPGTTVHLYGKSGCRPGRKMGHINVVGLSDEQVHERMSLLLDELSRAKEAVKQQQPWDFASAKQRAAMPVPGKPQAPQDFSHPQPLVGIIMGSDSDPVSYTHLTLPTNREV